jgi:4-diphosphocytidyl-2-C-methyl-D-erythritol kinase
MTPAREPSQWPAPAKLNLFLHIVGRREDGYHLMQTVFQLVDLADQIELRVTGDGRIRRQLGLADVAQADDLAVRAAQALQQFSGCRQGADIWVHKHVPVGAGLGGGSSDAATVLLALNELWQTGLSATELLRLGRSLGADVPVFIAGESCWAEGIGDEFVPLELADCWYVIVYPDESVNTASVFADPALTRNTPHTTIPRLLSGEPTHNDLQAVVCARSPRVAAALDWLQGYSAARMSGSGSAVFAKFAGAAEAEAVARQCPPQWQVFVARGLPRSPLHQALEAWRRRER